MDAVEFVRCQFAAARRLGDAIIGGTTDEQFNWLPPGTANPIKTAFVHLVVSEDGFIQQTLLAQPRIWEADGWSAKIGLPVPPGRGQGWEEIKQTPLALAAVLSYQTAVRSATDAYLARLMPEDLDRSAAIFGGQRPIAEVLALLVTHMLGHFGEIAALKGIQGVKGLPF